MDNTVTLILELLFSMIGFGIFIYGWRQKAPIPLMSGLVLWVFPYFVSSNSILIIGGLALMAVPYFWRV